MKTEKLDLSKINVVNLLDDSLPGDPSSEDDVADKDNEEATENVDETPVEEEAVEASKDDDQEPSEEEHQAEKAQDSESGDVSIIDELKQRLGYELEGDFEDSVDGLLEFTKGTADQMAQDQIETLFERFPDVREYMNYRADGGDAKKYFQISSSETDYSNLEVSSDDIKTQKAIVSQTLEDQGFSPEEIQETLEDYEDADILEKHASKALKRLQKKQESAKEKLITTQKEEAAKAAQENEARWKEISDIVDNGSLNGLNVPQREKKKFFEWLAVPVDNHGNSQRTLERDKLDQETMLALEYIVYKGFDLNKLAENTMKTAKAQSLRKRLGGATTASSRLKGGKTQRAGISLPTLDEVF